LVPWSNRCFKLSEILSGSSPQDGRARGKTERETVHCKVSHKRFSGIQQDTYGTRRVAWCTKDFTRDEVLSLSRETGIYRYHTLRLEDVALAEAKTDWEYAHCH
jgi:hypothetical protein